MRQCILGIGFDCLTMQQAVAAAADMLRANCGGMICTPNPEIVWNAQHDPALIECINSSDLVLADGIGIIWAGKKLGAPFPERLPGCEFLQTLLGEVSCSLYILGGKPGVAEQAAKTVDREYPGIHVVGCSDGYYADEDSVLEQVAAAAPQLLMVCLGSPKQEFFMQRSREKLPGCLMIGLGGTVDVLAGTEKRAPKIFLKLNLEWLYRLLRHPGRLKRQLAIPQFMAAVRKECRKQFQAKPDQDT